MKVIIHVGLLFIVVVGANAQSKVIFSGYVPDETSGEDLIGALVKQMIFWATCISTIINQLIKGRIKKAKLIVTVLYSNESNANKPNPNTKPENGSIHWINTINGELFFRA